MWEELEEKPSLEQRYVDGKVWDQDKIIICLSDLSWLEQQHSWIAGLCNEISASKTTFSCECVDDENTRNEIAFNEFLKTHLNDPKYKNKFVAFVNGKLQDVGNKKNALIEKIYDKFGNVDMYVDRVTHQKEIILIDTPEFQ